MSIVDEPVRPSIGRRRQTRVVFGLLRLYLLGGRGAAVLVPRRRPRQPGTVRRRVKSFRLLEDERLRGVGSHGFPRGGRVGGFRELGRRCFGRDGRLCGGWCFGGLCGRLHGRGLAGGGFGGGRLRGLYLLGRGGLWRSSDRLGGIAHHYQAELRAGCRPGEGRRRSSCSGPPYCAVLWEEKSRD